MFGGMPAEIITMLIGGLFTGLLKLWSMKAETNRIQAGLLMERFTKQQEGYKAAREYRNKGYQLTQAFIAITATFFIIAWPKLAPIINPDLPVTIGWTEIKNGFLFFTDDKTVTIWRTVEKPGLIMTPLDTHAMSAIIGMFFGSNVVGSR